MRPYLRFWMLLGLIATTSLVIEACSSKEEPARISGTEMAASSPPLPTPPPPSAPSAQEQFTKHLSDLGATEGAQGWVISLSSADYKPGQVAFEPGDTERIAHIAEFLKANLAVRATVKAYTDDRGAKSANQLLSQKRADAVVHALTERGVPEGQLQASGLGEDNPVSTNATAEGRQDNRRIDILFSNLEGQYTAS